jgi:hypothetical protein
LKQKPKYDSLADEKKDKRRILLGCQMHPEKHHPTSCFKYCKNVNKTEVCRYHFPFALNDKTIPKEVIFHGSKVSQFRVVMKRNNSWINNYNWDILQFFRGNMDIQCVCNPHGVAQYAIGNYIAKADRPDKTLLSLKMLSVLGSERNSSVLSDNN